MTSIKAFIQQEVLVPRLKTTGAGVLVVYDPQQRYRDLCLELAGEKRVVVDATEGSIESRERAIATLQELGEPPGERPIDEMIVYVPAKPPATDEDRQADPFAIYGVCGEVFPSGDGDEYRSLCLSAKPDHATEIRRIFSENPDPPFAVIDAVGGGAGWPSLQAALGVESGREILLALLAPTNAQLEKLKDSEGWVSEAKDLFQSSLGLKLITRGKTWQSVADELWRFVLFSEFAFDLPTELPPTLGSMPRADADAEPVINALCDDLRDRSSSQAIYMERAERIERDLGLVAACESIADLGKRDTFPFEERYFFSQAADALQRDNLDRLRKIVARHENSIWAGRGENQAQWTLLHAAQALIERCDDVRRQLPDHSGAMDSLLAFYVTSAREVDRLHREFELSVGDVILAEDAIESIITQARKAYGACAHGMHSAFMNHLESSGWPIDARVSNVQVFEKFVAPRLQESGRRVGLILIDALRYELGVELYKQLAEEGTIEVQCACAQMPTVTPIGMASLLPGAAEHLTVNKIDDRAVPFIGETRVKDLSQRLALLRDTFGQRFSEITLRDFAKKKHKVNETVDLLVIRSNDIDEQLESNTDLTTALRYIQWNLKDIRVAIRRLRDAGFHDVVIATDHGFVISAEQDAGGVCEKPPGNWVNLHDRALLGDGSANGGVLLLPTEHLGVRGDFSQIAMPRALTAFKAGLGYFHGGASLQEAVVPVITVQLPSAKSAKASKPSVELTYKRGARKITTRLPVVDVSVSASDLFAMDTPVEILVEAQDRSGSVVGEAKPGGEVNPATGTATILPNRSAKVPVRMLEEFRGKFTLKALDPATLVVLASIDLETDYLE